MLATWFLAAPAAQYLDPVTAIWIFGLAMQTALAIVLHDPDGNRVEIAR
jgi:hypothetical protein